MGGMQSIPLGTHHPDLRWAHYDAAGNLTRELVAEEVPPTLTLVNVAPGWLTFRDRAGDGYYLAMWAASALAC